MTPQPLNWAGWPIKDGESYGGRPENIPKPWIQKPAKAENETCVSFSAAKHYEVITENDVRESFGNGAYKLTRAEAAKRLELLTHAHRTTAYRALRPNGRFAQHLHSDGTLLSWR